MKRYTKRTKLADIVSKNPILLSVLERLNIQLGFGEATIGEICTKYNLSPDLFIEICNLYIFEDYTPSVDKIGTADITMLVEYLNTSHKYYKEKSLPSLHTNIHKLLENKSGASINILRKFYDDYDKEIASHFEYEENEVFPYVNSLVCSKGEAKSISNGQLCIDTFDENHTNIEVKISDLKSIVIKYLPEDFSYSAKIAVLKDIFEIEADLLRHTILEDRLLIPLVKRLEKGR